MSRRQNSNSRDRPLKFVRHLRQSGPPCCVHSGLQTPDRSYRRTRPCLLNRKNRQRRLPRRIHPASNARQDQSQLPSLPHRRPIRWPPKIQSETGKETRTRALPIETSSTTFLPSSCLLVYYVQETLYAISTVCD